jgi:predicted nucleic acid-binding protein
LRLVVDTNVLLKALVRDSRVRGILLSPADQFIVPEFALEEFGEHIGLVAARSGLSEAKVRLALSVLLTNIEVVPREELSAVWGEAEDLIGSVDPDDVPFVAVALVRSCDGIWSDDKHLKKQGAVRVWTTADMVQRR